MTAERRKPQTGKQLLLRFAEGSDLRERLDEVARANGRSTTAEVLLRLEASLRADQNSGSLSFLQAAKSAASKADSRTADLEARLAAVEKAVKALEASQSTATSS